MIEQFEYFVTCMRTAYNQTQFYKKLNNRILQFLNFHQ
jgi:hypothetical protein